MICKIFSIFTGYRVRALPHLLGLAVQRVRGVFTIQKTCGEHFNVKRFCIYYCYFFLVSYIFCISYGVVVCLLCVVSEKTLEHNRGAVSHCSIKRFTCSVWAWYILLVYGTYSMFNQLMQSWAKVECKNDLKTVSFELALLLALCASSLRLNPLLPNLKIHYYLK